MIFERSKSLLPSTASEQQYMFCSEGEAGLKNREFHSSPLENCFYLGQSVRKSKSKDTVENHRDFAGKYLSKS